MNQQRPLAQTNPNSPKRSPGNVLKESIHNRGKIFEDMPKFDDIGVSRPKTQMNTLNLSTIEENKNQGAFDWSFSKNHVGIPQVGPRALYTINENG